MLRSKTLLRYRLILAKTGAELSYKTFWKGRYESERFPENQCRVAQQVTIRSDLLRYHGATLSVKDDARVH